MKTDLKLHAIIYNCSILKMQRNFCLCRCLPKQVCIRKNINILTPNKLCPYILFWFKTTFELTHSFIWISSLFINYIKLYILIKLYINYISIISELKYNYVTFILTQFILVKSRFKCNILNSNNYKTHVLLTGFMCKGLDCFVVTITAGAACGLSFLPDKISAMCVVVYNCLFIPP